MSTRRSELDAPLQQRVRAAIVEKLDERGLAQIALAHHLGINRNTLHQKLSGKRALSFSEAARACMMLDISLDDLLND